MPKAFDARSDEFEALQDAAEGRGVDAPPHPSAMEKQATDPLLATDSAEGLDETSPDAPPELVERSQSFLGRWNRLVSSTNWEKGRIIIQWRRTLIDSGFGAAFYSDEAWARLTGQVSPQHAGRLRRVCERFGDVHSSYEGLYWSHFLAALEWNDAEMWLEGAMRGNWSVPRMKDARREALGDPLAPEAPVQAEVFGAEFDEDAAIEDYHDTGETPLERDGVERSFADQAKSREPEGKESASADAPWEDTAANTLAQPFADLIDLPEDLADAFEECKIAILRHKLAGWAEITPQALAMHLDALKALAMAPSGN